MSDAEAAEDAFDRTVWSKSGRIAKQQGRRFHRDLQKRIPATVPRGKFGGEGWCSRCGNTVRTSFRKVEPHYWFMSTYRKGKVSSSSVTSASKHADNCVLHVSEVAERFLCVPCFGLRPHHDRIVGLNYYNGKHHRHTRCDCCGSSRRNSLELRYFSGDLFAYISLSVCHKCTKNRTRVRYTYIANHHQVEENMRARNVCEIHPTRGGPRAWCWRE